MGSELNSPSTTSTIDVSGLPEPVVQGIKQLVESLRAGLPREETVPAKHQRFPLRGRFADLKLSIPKEDIDAAQHEAWAGFPREFPEAAQS